MVHVLSVSADETARRVAVDAVAGRVPLVEARSRIAELVIDSTIPEDVASRSGLTGQAVVDLAQGLRDKVVRLLLEDTDFFAIERLVDGSFEGWLRQSMKAMVPYEQAYRPRHMGSRIVLVDDFPDWRPRDLAERQWLDRVERQSPEDSVLEALAAGRESELVEIARRTRKQRPESLRFATASAIRAVLGLPGLCVPTAPDDRDFVLTACDADHLLADRSRRSTIESLREGGQPSTVDERLLALWDDMTVEQMARLDSYPPAATHVLVVGSLEPMPKPSRAVVRAMRKELREAGDNSMAWASATQRLLEAWMARWCRAVSEFDDTNDASAKAAKNAAAAQAAASWPATSAEVCAWPSSPLGATAEAVEQEVGAIFLRAMDAETARRIGT